MYIKRRQGDIKMNSPKVMEVEKFIKSCPPILSKLGYVDMIKASGISWEEALESREFISHAEIRTANYNDGLVDKYADMIIGFEMGDNQQFKYHIDIEYKTWNGDDHALNRRINFIDNPYKDHNISYLETPIWVPITRYTFIKTSEVVEKVNNGSVRPIYAFLNPFHRLEINNIWM